MMVQDELRARKLQVAHLETERAISEMLYAYKDNHWFLKIHWPINEPHVRHMIKDVISTIGAGAHLFDIGCFNGYISYLFKLLGYQVTGTDAIELPEMRRLSLQAEIEFFLSNFNDHKPFSQITGNSFDVVIIAQVIEHVLNHPLGLMEEIARVLKPDGLLILTTPHPANIMNAVRVILNRSSLWGTRDFMELPKISEKGIITAGEIHYREYLTHEISHLLDVAGFEVKKIRYLGLGAGADQSVWKRLLKKNPIVKNMMKMRLFASNQYFLARRRYGGFQLGVE